MAGDPTSGCTETCASALPTYDVLAGVYASSPRSLLENAADRVDSFIDEPDTRTRLRALAPLVLLKFNGVVSSSNALEAVYFCAHWNHFEPRDLQALSNHFRTSVYTQMDRAITALGMTDDYKDLLDMLVKVGQNDLSYILSDAAHHKEW